MDYDQYVSITHHDVRHEAPPAQRIEAARVEGELAAADKAAVEHDRAVGARAG